MCLSLSVPPLLRFGDFYRMSSKQIVFGEGSGVPELLSIFLFNWFLMFALFFFVLSDASE